MAELKNEKQILTCIENYRNEAEDARRDRIDQNQLNYDTYHLRQDYSHKAKGQSQEFIPKQSMAVEQISNFMAQGLVDIGEWFSVQSEYGLTNDEMRIKPKEIQVMLDRMLKKANIIDYMEDQFKTGLLGSLMIAKVTGKYCPKPKYKTDTKLNDDRTYSRRLIKIEDKYWELNLSIVRQEDYYPDPTGRGLYEMEDIYMDWYQVKQLSEGKDAIYDKEVVEQIKGMSYTNAPDDQYSRNRETGLNTYNQSYRNVVKLTEFWGTILDEDGAILYENVVCTIANDEYIIQKPTPNPLWHGESPYVVAPIISVPHSKWGKSLMDSPTMLNRALNELFNLILDGGMMSVHGIKQLRTDWLENPAQVSDGISAGDTLLCNGSMPPGAKVLERVDTSSVPQDGLAVYNLLTQEIHSGALTSDLRMGSVSARAVKATEVIESSQAITSMLSGVAKRIEEQFITKLLNKSWLMIAQHHDKIDYDWMAGIFGTSRANEISQMTKEEMFAETAGGYKIRVFGVTGTLNKMKDFTKVQSFLQTLGSSPVFVEEFVKSGYSFGKLLTVIMHSLDIDDSKLKDETVPVGGPAISQEPVNPASQPNMQSQIPQAGAEGNQGDLQTNPGNITGINGVQ